MSHFEVPSDRDDGIARMVAMLENLFDADRRRIVAEIYFEAGQEERGGMTGTIQLLVRHLADELVKLGNALNQAHRAGDLWGVDEHVTYYQGLAAGFAKVLALAAAAECYAGQSFVAALSVQRGETTEAELQEIASQSRRAMGWKS